MQTTATAPSKKGQADPDDARGIAGAAETLTILGEDRPLVTANPDLVEPDDGGVLVPGDFKAPAPCA
ncbi:MAG: hypothetical protein ACLP6E_17940 [Acidimicrobiales bacterium]